MKKRRLCIIVLCSTFFAACNRNRIDTAPVPDTQTASPSSSTMTNQLQAAVNAEDFDAIERLITEGANPNTVLQDETSLLQKVIKKGNIPLIHFLIRNGADVNYVNPTSNSVFNYAAYFLPDEELPFFIDNGLNLLDKTTANNGKECSYFEYLIYNNKLQTAQVFLTHGEVLQDVLNDTQMDVKLVAYWESGTQEILDNLISKGLKLNTDAPLLHSAIRSVGGGYDAVKWLLDHGISPSENKKDFDTPLETAYVQYRIANGAIDGSRDEKRSNEMQRIMSLLKERIGE